MISRRPVSFQAYCRPMKRMKSEIHAEMPEVSDTKGPTAVRTSRNSATAAKGMRGRAARGAGEGGSFSLAPSWVLEKGPRELKGWGGGRGGGGGGGSAGGPPPRRKGRGGG